MKPGRVDGRFAVIPNLGAEESDEGRAYRHQPPVRAAAHLFLLLFGRRARLWPPPVAGEPDTDPISRDALWPESLAPAPEASAFAWLDDDTTATAWYASAEAARFARDGLESELAGPPPAVVAKCHDKAFAVEAAQDLGLGKRALTRLVEIISPQELRDPEPLLSRLEQALADWPDWCEGRFTLKPRFGSSGRGRIGGRDQIDTPSIRGGFTRLAERGGAIFEPWLDRTTDLSVSMHIPDAKSSETLPTILGSLEMWTSRSGVYRGHCGEVDSRGRVFSGDRQDEALRADAAAVASRARTHGFFGPCGIDAFRYREPSTTPSNQPNPGGPNADAAITAIDRLRPLVEFNARPTMGLVTIGLVRRALPRVREALALTPGDRRGFALTYFDRNDREWRERLHEGLGSDCIPLDLSTENDSTDPRPVLVFARDPEVIRAARAAVFDC